MSTFAFASSLLDLTPGYGRPEQRCLRPYQERVVRDFLTFADEARVHSAERFGRIILPPRTGKTAIAACIARELRLPATFLVPTKTLVEQTASEVESWLGEPVGVLYSDRKEPLPGGTNVTTYAQLERCPPAIWSGLARAPLVFADEAHHTLTIERFRLLESRFSPEALRVALTATPDYDEVRALCRFFPRLIHELPLEDALDLGLMAPLRVWVLEVDADASGVRVVAGDYEDATLGSVMGSQLFLDAALRLRYAPANRNTRALVTCRTRAQAHQLTRFFERHQPVGAPRVGLILGDTKTDQRKQLLADFEAGAVDTLVQVGVLIEGWDSAVCKVLIDLSPSLSLVRSAQKYFRVLTAHAEREARIYVLLPTGLSGLPMLPNDLFGASLRHYECGALIGPDDASESSISALELPPLDRVRARPKLVHHARLERPLLPRGDRAAVLEVIAPWLGGNAPRTLSQLLRHRFNHPLFVGSGYALLRWLGYAPSVRGIEALVAWLESGFSGDALAPNDQALDSLWSVCRFPRAARDVEGCELDRARIRAAWRQPPSTDRRAAEIDAARAGFRAATGRGLGPASNPEAMLIQRELEQYAVRLLWTLSPRERRLLARQYGLLDQPPLSTTRIAELESVSRGRIFQVIKVAHRKLQARCHAGFSRLPAGVAAGAVSSGLFISPELEEPVNESASPRAVIDAPYLAELIEWFARVRGVAASTWTERPPMYSPYRLPRRDESGLAWRKLSRPLLLAALCDNVDRLIQLLEDGSHRARGQRLSPLQIIFPTTRGASLTARAMADETLLELLLEEQHGTDFLGNEHRTFAAHVKLQEIVPGVALQFMGHAPPGRCCSELQLEALAIDWSPANSLRAPLAVARALARVCEEAQNTSGARPG